MVFRLQRIPLALKERRMLRRKAVALTSAALLTTAGSLCTFVPAAHAGADAGFENPGQTTFHVPAGVCSITAQVEGAEGGKGGATPDPGKGGAITGTFAVTPGETLSIFVGGQGGDDGSAGVNGGGAGGS